MIRHEFSVGFRRWYRERTGRTVFLDWRNVGGTSDITRYLDGQYDASFRYLWTAKLGKPWSAEIQAGYKKGRLPADAPAIVKEARGAFRQSDVGCGMDVFFGGGPYDFEQEAAAGRRPDAGLTAAHPDWFTESAFPWRFNGEFYRDPNNLWIGDVMSSFGILYNKDSLKRIGFDREPDQWADLADPRFFGQGIGLCDPTESGSILVAFENLIQQRIEARLDELRASDPMGDPKVHTAAAVRQGWLEGLRLIQIIGANARYFTDTSQKPPIDVATGDCAAGMCIDFYGREQQEAVRRRNDYDRLGYVAPEGGSSYSVDPIALLRGAPHRAVAVAFMEYVLSLEGQKLWNFRVGTPDGPDEFALRRLPVRRDFYGRADWLQYRSVPQADPYSQEADPDPPRRVDGHALRRAGVHHQDHGNRHPRRPCAGLEGDPRGPGAQEGQGACRPPGPFRRRLRQRARPHHRKLRFQEQGRPGGAGPRPGRGVPRKLPARRDDRPRP